MKRDRTKMSLYPSFSTLVSRHKIVLLLYVRVFASYTKKRKRVLAVLDIDISSQTYSLSCLNKRNHHRNLVWISDLNKQRFLWCDISVSPQNFVKDASLCAGFSTLFSAFGSVVNTAFPQFSCLIFMYPTLWWWDHRRQLRPITWHWWFTAPRKTGKSLLMWYINFLSFLSSLALLLITFATRL